MNFVTDVDHRLDRTLVGFQPSELCRPWPTGGLCGASSLGVAARDKAEFERPIGTGTDGREHRPLRPRTPSMTANAQTLRAWREAHPEKYEAQKARQTAKRQAARASAA